MSAGGMAREAASELLGLERRLPHTIASVLLHPGAATLDHREGRGARHVSPVRFYILASTLYFATSLAAAARGLNLGILVAIPGTTPVTRLSPAVVLILVAPIFALFLGGLYYRGSSTFGEYLAFALYLQSALFLVLVIIGILRIPDPADDIVKLAYFVGYVWLGTRRLWPRNKFVDAGRAIASLLGYLIAVMLVVGVLSIVDGWMP